jgi:hypothetical protein
MDVKMKQGWNGCIIGRLFGRGGWSGNPLCEMISESKFSWLSDVGGDGDGRDG